MSGGNMYRRGGGGFPALLMVIVIGIVFGLGYLAYDNLFNRPQIEPLATSTFVPDLISTPVIEAAAVVTAVPAPREVTEGARFSAPTAGINGDVVQTYLNGVSWDVSQLGPNVGHLEGTAWLNMPGNIVLAGHVEMSDGRPGIFANIDELDIGDPVYLMQNDVEQAYQVTQKFATAPDNLQVLYPSQTEKITLITCSDYDFLSDVYRQRVIVIAERLR